MDRKVFCAITLTMAFSGTFVDDLFGKDWPQILGPNRNAIAVDEHLTEKWPKEGPKKVWNKKVGSGIAGVAIKGNVGILFHRLNDDDVLRAFNCENGDVIWETKFPTTYQSSMLDDDGPRAVPTIHEASVFAYSPQGRLYCVEFDSGNKQWERKTHQDFGADGGYFGAACSPLVEGEFVIVNVGGSRMKAGVVAFHADSGKTAWTAVNDTASYSTPIAVTIDGTRHLLCVTRLNFVSLDPLTGKEQFRSKFGSPGPTVNAAAPVVSGNHVLLTASYGIGAEWLKIDTEKVDVEWQSDKILSSQYTTPILYDGAVFGIDGRQDRGSVALKCFDPNSRKEFWSKSGIGYATLIAAKDLMLMMQTDGVLKLIRLSKDRYDELGSVRLLPGTTRALPALANGHLYVRNESTLLCVDLSAN